jgi:hypothetical protein
VSAPAPEVTVPVMTLLPGARVTTVGAPGLVDKSPFTASSHDARAVLGARTIESPVTRRPNQLDMAFLRLFKETPDGTLAKVAALYLEQVGDGVSDVRRFRCRHRRNRLHKAMQ